MSGIRSFLRSVSIAPRPVETSDVSSDFKSNSGLAESDAYLSSVNEKISEGYRWKSNMNGKMLEKMKNRERRRQKNRIVVGVLILINILIVLILVFAILAATGHFKSGKSDVSHYDFNTKQEGVDVNKVCPQRNCEEIKLLNQSVTSGVYSIWTNCSNSSNSIDNRCCVEVYCDMETFGGGWTVVQTRFNGSVDFHRNWADYSRGFGSPGGEFWAGNNFLYFLTESTSYELLVELLQAEKNCTLFARYENFSIEDQDYFSLNPRIQFKDGTAGDSLLGSEFGSTDDMLSSSRFSTFDQDNDDSPTYCARNANSGWWFRNCMKSNLNGAYHEGCTDQEDSMFWATARGHYYSFAASEIKLRTLNFSLESKEDKGNFCSDLSFEPCPADCRYNDWGPWGSCIQKLCSKPGSGSRERKRTDDVSIMKPLGVPCSMVGLSSEIDHLCTSDRCG